MFPSFCIKINWWSDLKINSGITQRMFSICRYGWARTSMVRKNYPGGFYFLWIFISIARAKPHIWNASSTPRKHVKVNLRGNIFKWIFIQMNWNCLPYGSILCHKEWLIPCTFTLFRRSAELFMCRHLLGPVQSSLKTLVLSGIWLPPRKAKADDRNQRFISVQPRLVRLFFESWMRHEVPPESCRNPKSQYQF